MKTLWVGEINGGRDKARIVQTPEGLFAEVQERGTSLGRFGPSLPHEVTEIYKKAFTEKSEACWDALGALQAARAVIDELGPLKYPMTFHGITRAIKKIVGHKP